VIILLSANLPNNLLLSSIKTFLLLTVNVIFASEFPPVGSIYCSDLKSISGEYLIVN